MIRCWFSLTGHVLYCFTSASLFLPYWALFALSHLMIQWFFLNGYGSYCFISCFTGASLLGMVRIVSFHASLVLHYWVWFVLFHFMLQWSFITGYGVCCFTSLTCFMSSFIGSSLLGIDYIVSFNNSLVLPYRAWFELFHFMLCWFLLNGLVYIVSLQASLVHYHSYIALFVVFH